MQTLMNTIKIHYKNGEQLTKIVDLTIPEIREQYFLGCKHNDKIIDSVTITSLNNSRKTT